MSKQYTGGLITKTPVVPTSLSASGVWSLSDQAEAQATNTWPFPRDPQFNYVTMLLHGDGSAGAVAMGSGAGTSSTVTNFNADASTNNFNIAINGDARSNNFNPYQAGYYSNYFDGTGDYLTIAGTSTACALPGDFTIECFYFQLATVNYGSIFSTTTTYSTANSLRISTGNNTNTFEVASSGGAIISASNAFTPNSWIHIALVRSGTTLTLYQNGVSVGSATNSTSFVSDTFIIGDVQGAGAPYALNGYISNFRVVKGTAVYTAAFTPPTSPLTAITNTSLLTCQSNRFIDNSTNAFTITVNGNTAVFPAIPFTLPSSVATYGSGFFDGTGDYLSAPSVPASGTGSFCFEAWIYPTNASTNQMIIGAVNGGMWVGMNIDTANKFSIGRAFTANDNEVSFTWANNRWYHVAVNRNGTSLQFFVDGVQIGSTLTNSINYSVAGRLIAAEGTTAATFYSGYIAGLRVVNASVYTSAFTPPTAPPSVIANTTLLTTQYNGGGNNNGFKDSSQNNFVITRNGNTTQGTFAPYGADWSNYFDGDGDGITSAVSAGFAFGTGDFTYEAWYYSLETSSSQRGMFDTRINSSSTSGVLLLEDSTNGFKVYINNTTLFTTTGRVANTWQHIALVRNSGTVRLYINGVQANSAASATNMTDPNCRISGFIDTQANPYGYLGYISNARVVKGTCLYPSGTTFTPSITPLTAISGTSLLTCQGNRFFDASSNALAITVNGSPSVQGFSPFAPLTVYNPATYGGSGYFDGTGDYLGCGSQSAYAYGTGNFTLEAWVYVISRASEYNIAATRGAAGSVTGWSFAVTTSGGVIFYSNSAIFNGVGTVPLNAWTHIAITREGTGSNQVKLYINGVSTATSTSAENYSNTTLAVGASNDGSQYPFLGYISDYRMTKGTALYTASFTPATAPLTAISGTSLLVSTTNPAILDNSMLNNLETVGNAQISTSVVKYGTASMYFDGTGDCLTTPSSVNFNFGTGNFTIEMWVYATSMPTYPSAAFLLDSRTNASWVIFLASNQLYFGDSTGTEHNSGTVSTNAWYHIAICRSSGTTTGYINGVSAFSFLDSGSYVGSPILTIGARYTNTLGLSGYIDDLRITKGYARYTTTFTPPTQAFPNG